MLLYVNHDEKWRNTSCDRTENTFVPSFRIRNEFSFWPKQLQISKCSHISACTYAGNWLPTFIIQEGCDFLVQIFTETEKHKILIEWTVSHAAHIIQEKDVIFGGKNWEHVKSYVGMDLKLY